MEKVLVTGGSGFIALHCIDQLLEKGFMVRTTIRSESRKDEINKAMEKYPNLHQNLEFPSVIFLKTKDGMLQSMVVIMFSTLHHPLS